MSVRRLILGLAIVAGTLGLATAAQAATAYAASTVNVRSGPGTGHAVVDTLRRGERVDVQYCRGSWCFVEKSGPDGWVSASYLDRGGRYDRYDDDDYFFIERPRFRPWARPYWGSQFCWGGNTASFCVRN